MIRIIDYEAGNLTSVRRALDFLQIPSEITSDPDRIARAERIIFPGVGHAGSAVRVLKERNLDKALRDAFSSGTPILGICLGTQIILSHSEEGDTKCLDLMPGEVRLFKTTDPGLKIPHMGWNTVTVTQRHYLLKDVRPGDEFYFVHSYYPSPAADDMVFATCDYEIEFAAAIGTKNLFATQFHPEKSGRIGLQILKRFASWDGGCHA